jgi:hypothetical protein
MLDFKRAYQVARNLSVRGETAATEKYFKGLLFINAGGNYLKLVRPGSKTESITHHLFSTKRERQGFVYPPLSFFAAASVKFADYGRSLRDTSRPHC